MGMDSICSIILLCLQTQYKRPPHMARSPRHEYPLVHSTASSQSLNLSLYQAREQTTVERWRNMQEDRPCKRYALLLLFLLCPRGGRRELCVCERICPTCPSLPDGWVACPQSSSAFSFSTHSLRPR